MAPKATDNTPRRAAQVKHVINLCIDRRAAGEQVTDESLIADHPDLMPELADELRNLQLVQRAQAGVEQNAAGALNIRCPHCHNPVEVLDDASLSDVVCPSCGSQFSLTDDSDRTFQAGPQEMVNHFQLLDRVGIGAFGSVWSARDTQLDRRVAIKIPRKGQLSPEDSEQFIREARAAAQLKHPNIVSVLEVGRHKDRIYIASDFVQGLDLADWLTDQQSTPREAAELCATLADALQHAHEQGVIHRDLKPSNIMLDTAGEPHLMDFGLAKRESGEMTMTVEGKLLGTPAYMSPEQARGAAHDADARSDVYSLGVILFEMLTGERPFRGSTRMLLHQVLVEDAPSPRKLNSQIPKDLETICLKCLEKAPDGRFQTAGDLREELRRFLRGEPVESRPISKLTRAWRWCQRKPIVAGLGATVAALLLILGIAGPIVAVRQGDLAQREASANRDAKQEAERYRRLLYSSDMQSAQSNWISGNVNDVIPLLERHYPQTDEEDLRGFEWYYLWRNCQRHIMTPTIQTEYVSKISFSDDGATITTMGGNAIRRWNVLSRELLDERLIDVKFESDASADGLSRDGNLYATGGQDGTVAILELVSGNRRDLGRLASSVYLLKFSPDNKQLAAGGVDGSIGLWQVESGNRIAVVQPHDDRIYSLAFSPNGTTLASGSRDGTAKLWDVSSGKMVMMLDLRPHCKSKSSVVSIAFSPIDKILAIGTSGDHLVTLWNIENGKLLYKSTSHTQVVNGVAFSPDGTILASSSNDHFVKLWDVVSGELTDTFNAGLYRAGVDVGQRMAISPDRTILACPSRNGVVKLWPISSNEKDVLKLHEDNIHCVSFSPDGRTLASSSADKTVAIWDVTTGKMRFRLKGHDELVSSVTFSPTGELVSSLSNDNTVKLWDTSTGRLLDTLRLNAILTTSRDLEHAVSPNGELMAVVRPNGTLNIWNLKTRESTSLHAYKDSEIFSIRFSPDGGSFATSSAIDDVKIWDAKSLKLEQTITGRALLAYSPNGRFLAIGTEGVVGIRLWDLVLRREIWSNPQRQRPITSLVFSSDGRTIIGAGRDGWLRSYNTSSGELQFSMPAHRDEIWAVAISPDGRTLATGGSEDTIKLWRAATNGEVEQMRRRWQETTAAKEATGPAE